jgi:hypothetical protein
MIDVVWTATSPVSGRFDPVETRSDIEVLNDRFATLRARGEGYLEIRRSTDFPLLTVGFCGSAAVVQAFTSAGTMALLEGDGSVSRDLLAVPVLDETADFVGAAGVRLDRAWSLVQGFLAGSALPELGVWIEL